MDPPVRGEDKEGKGDAEMQSELAAVRREEKGKQAAKRLRRRGMIPAVLYGHGFEALPLAIEKKSFHALLRRERGLHGLLSLKVEGDEDGKHTVLVKELQRHPLRDEILHVDFQRVRGDEELSAEVSLNFLGEPKGVKAGGILQHYLYEVTVQCLPKDLPEVIDVDISHLQLKENLRICDLPAIEGVRYLNNPEEIVVAITPKRVREAVAIAEEEAAEEEAAAEVAATVEEEAKEAGEEETSAGEESE